MQTVRPRCASLAFGAALLSWGAASAADIETAALPTLEFGAHPRTNGWVDFGLRAPAADNAELLIYDTGDATIPAKVVPMTRDGAGDWGVRVRGPGVGTFYMYRLSGHGTATANAPFGTVLNDNFVLNDPYVTLPISPRPLPAGQHRGGGAASGGR
jgi:hypothetical protein